MKRLIALILIVFIVGCAPPLRKQMLNAGYDPNYIDGYIHGKSSGYQVTSIYSICPNYLYYDFQKDVQRYEINKQYRQGWDDGYAESKYIFKSIQRSFN